MKDGNISLGIIISWKHFHTCGDHILIKFLLGCIPDIKRIQKDATTICFTESGQATECSFTLFLTNIIDVRILCV